MAASGIEIDEIDRLGVDHGSHLQKRVFGMVVRGPCGHSVYLIQSLVAQLCDNSVARTGPPKPIAYARFVASGRPSIKRSLTARCQRCDSGKKTRVRCHFLPFRLDEARRKFRCALTERLKAHEARCNRCGSQ